VIVHGAKAPDGDRKDLVQFFESLVDPIFPLRKEKRTRTAIEAVSTES
jgi:hypothetical protein